MTEQPGMVFETYLKNILDNGEPEVGTAYLAYACQILSGQAERMGQAEEVGYYREKAEGAKAAYRSPMGKIVSAWEYKDDGIHYHVSIPGNCTAQVKLPFGQCEEVSEGEYHYIEKI